MPNVSFNRDNIAKMAADDRHACGQFARINTDAEFHESENNDNIMLRVASKALEDPEDGDSQKGMNLYQYLTLPLDNLDADGHVAPKWSGRMAAEYLSACFPEDVPAPPKRFERGGPLYYKGEEIDRADERACRHEAIEAAGLLSEKLADDPSMLVNRGYFCEVHYPKKNPEFPSQRNFLAEMPEDWELSDKYIEETEVVDNGGRGAKRKGGKKKGKKKSKRKGRK